MRFKRKQMTSHLVSELGGPLIIESATPLPADSPADSGSAVTVSIAKT